MQVLVVDDQTAVRTALQLLFEVHGLECLLASSPERALEQIRTEDVGVVVQDMNFTQDTTSGEEGVRLFHAIRKLDPELPVIMLTAWSSLETAVGLVKDGAHDYIEKPWDDAKLVVTVRNALRLREATQVNRRLRAGHDRGQRELRSRADLRGLIYQSQAMHELLSLAVRVAPSDAPVLITGPNGSGKERIAEIIQANSRRADKPFVRVNAGGLPDQLLEAELFGAEAGSFTGASKLRVGRFEAADGGTLFLDELGNLSSAGQMKLLRVLQTGEFQRLGSNVPRKTNVRVISATNADLPAQISAGTFREDLYFRLNVIELELPALSQRRADILPLADAFLTHFDETKRRSFAQATRNALEEHDWAGNVRELENRIQRAVLVGGDILQPADLGLGTTRSAAPAATPEANIEADAKPTATLQSPLETAEREVIETALDRANGVIARAAAELGLSRQALYRRMERLGITLERAAPKVVAARGES